MFILLICQWIFLTIASDVQRDASCPRFCQCYSDAQGIIQYRHIDRSKNVSLGYHLLCREKNLTEIPSDVILYLQRTTHQQIIVDLSSNRLRTIPCDLFQISTIKTLILTDNHLQTIPSCFSHSSIENLILTRNALRFNSTTLLTSRKLVHLDLSENDLPSLPWNFLHSLRRLRTLVMTSEEHLFHWSTSEWLRSIPSRNQLSLVLCNEHLPLSLCLFNHLFEEKKLFLIELHRQVFCDCTWIYLPFDRISFRQCFHSEEIPIVQCHRHYSRFEGGQRIDQLQKEIYRSICAEEYQMCDEEKEKSLRSFNVTYSSSPRQVLFTSVIVNRSLSNTTRTSRTNDENVKKITAGAIIPLIFLLVIVTIVCLYALLSRQYFRFRTEQKYVDQIFDKRKAPPVMDNLNTNSRPYPVDPIDDFDLTFYSLPDASLSHLSTIDASSSFSSETLVMIDGNRSNIYS